MRLDFGWERLPGARPNSKSTSPQPARGYFSSRPSPVGSESEDFRITSAMQPFLRSSDDGKFQQCSQPHKCLK